MAEIAVVGSANLDLVVTVPHHPRPGETVMGGDLRSLPGGKGANQATAAARLGREVAFIGSIGADSAGKQLRQSLEDAGVDTAYLRTVDDVPSGTALITVADDGDNAIVVSPGANRRLGPADLEAAGDVLTHAAVVLLQLEVSVETVSHAASRAGGVVILNPAPSQPLPTELLAAVDILVPNETELAALTGVDPHAPADELAGAARSLGVPAVIVTLGGRGAMLIRESAEPELRSAPTIDPIDTTAAGDAFCAALGDALVGQADLSQALTWAVRVGAATTLRPGAGPSLPTPDEVETLLAGATA